MVTKTNEKNYEAPVMQEAQMAIGGTQVLCSSAVEAGVSTKIESLGSWE